MTKSIEYINIENLILDDKNPRLPNYLHGTSDEKIIEFMLIEAATIELMQAIGENGYFEGEQLLVVKIDASQYKVIEGNRRLTSVKLLNNPDLAEVQTIKIKKIIEKANYFPTEIPCLVFDSEEEIHKYLGYRHITGIQPWNLRQKARYLYFIKEKNFSGVSLEQTCVELAKMIGSRRDYVRRILVGFMIYIRIKDNAFFRVKGLGEDNFFFGYISDSLSRVNIVDFLGVNFNCDDPLSEINIEHLSKWTHWLFEKNAENKTRLKGKSEDLNKLNKILSNKMAFKAFEEKGVDLESAYELTEDVDEIFMNSISKSLVELEQANGLIHKVKKFENSLENDLRQISKLAKHIKTIKDEVEFDDDF